MANKPLWSDDKINSLTFKNANNLDPDARWMHEQIVKDMRNDYERALSLRLAAAEECRAELLADIPTIQHNAELPQYDPVWVRTLWQAYNELQVAQWQPLQYATVKSDNHVLIIEDTHVIGIEGDNKSLAMRLPDDYAICRKVQP